MKSFRLLSLLAAFLLAGCGSQNTIWEQYYQVLREGWRNSTGRGTVTLEQAAAIPYASLAYRIDGGNEALLVLATNSDGDLLWTAASKVVLQTRDGRILRSVGLPHDRGGMFALSRGALPSPADARKAPYRSVRVADFPALNLHSVPVNCVAAARPGRQLVIILGKAIAAVRVDETCNSQNPRWSFTDSYWLDPDSGFVWQSLQHLTPQGPVVQVKILRPPE